MNSQRVALVTGSSRGIGLATAKALAGRGFSIALNGPVDNQELKKALNEVKALSPASKAFAFDVSDISVHDAKLDAIEAELGPVTTLVNNAGVSVLERGDVLDVTPESYDRCMAVNARAVFFLSQAVARRFVSQMPHDNVSRSIVNISSISAQMASLTRGEYCVSKSAAGMISKVFACRLGELRVPVFDIRPGLISTDMTAPVIEVYEQQARDGLCLFPYVGAADEVGRVVASLAAGDLPYVTGQVIAVDGGLGVARF